mgnify:FL=1
MSQNHIPLAKQQKSELRNLCGTFEAEGIIIRRSTRNNLERIASGQATYQQVLQELRQKYAGRG